jgi:predicted Co/Zn/Cd cation transporter (cation efflux family)
LAADPTTRPDDESTAAIAQALQDVSEKAQLLVREEIELAKTEIQGKVKTLVRGSVAGIVGGVFALVGLSMVLNGLAWLAYWLVTDQGSQAYFWGFFIMAFLLFLLGGLAAVLALRLIKKGSPPKPELALQEAQRIRATVQSSQPENTI